MMPPDREVAGNSMKVVGHNSCVCVCFPPVQTCREDEDEIICKKLAFHSKYCNRHYNRKEQARSLWSCECKKRREHGHHIHACKLVTHLSILCVRAAPVGSCQPRLHMMWQRVEGADGSTIPQLTSKLGARKVLVKWRRKGRPMVEWWYVSHLGYFMVD